MVQGVAKSWTWLSDWVHNNTCFYLFIFLLATQCGLQDYSSLTRDQTRAHCSRSMESWPLHHQESPNMHFYKWKNERNQAEKMRSLKTDVMESVCVYTHVYIGWCCAIKCKRNNRFLFLELRWIDFYPCSNFKMLVALPWWYLDMNGKTPARLVEAWGRPRAVRDVTSTQFFLLLLIVVFLKFLIYSLWSCHIAWRILVPWPVESWSPNHWTTREVPPVPVLVKGIEKSCWRSWFSDALSMTTTSAARVSLFFSRTPEASYNTCNIKSKSQVSQYCPHHSVARQHWHCLRSVINRSLYRIHLYTAMLLNLGHQIRGTTEIFERPVYLNSLFNCSLMKRVLSKINHFRIIKLATHNMRSIHLMRLTLLLPPFHCGQTEA